MLALVSVLCGLVLFGAMVLLLWSRSKPLVMRRSSFPFRLATGRRLGVRLVRVRVSGRF